MSEPEVITITRGDVTATCQRVESAAALMRMLRDVELGSAPVLETPASDQKPARVKRAPRKAKEAAPTASTGERRSVSGAIRDAIRVNGADPDLDAIAREFYPGESKGTHKVKQNLYALVSKGTIKKLASGGWKVVG